MGRCRANCWRRSTRWRASASAAAEFEAGLLAADRPEMIVATEDVRTLQRLCFHRPPRHDACGRGDGKQMHGQSGADLTVSVPPGAIVQRRLPDGEWELVAEDEARAEFQRRLARFGVVAALRRAGVRNGDRVRFGPTEITWDFD